MKWGRNKVSLPSSTRPSLISSWLGKFKKLGSSSMEQKPERAKHRGRLNFPTSTSSMQYTSRKGSQFYRQDGDAFWRIPFEEEDADKSTSRSAVQSAWHYSYDKFAVPELSCENCRSSSKIAEGREDADKFSDMVYDARKTREMCIEARRLPKLNICKREAEENFSTSRRVARKDCKLTTQDRRCLEEDMSEVEEDEESEAAQFKPKRVSENDTVEHGSVKTTRTHVSNSRIYGNGSPVKLDDFSSENCENGRFRSYINMDKGNEVFDLNVSPDWKKLKALKIAEFKAKTEKQKSVYMSREVQKNKPKHGNKVRVFSPRTTSKVEVCKIKALEDIKKANRLRMRKKVRARIQGVKSNLDDFAVMKCSYDPQKDFRDSMIEMIVEKRMHRPDELEELLACYLTLNSDEYHDLIIKVFKEVWFQLNQESSRTEFQDQYCC